MLFCYEFEVLWQKRTMVTIRLHIWRVVHPILLWTLLFLTVYWYNAKDSNSLQINTLHKLNKLETARRKPSQAIHGDDVTHLIKDNESDDSDIHLEEDIAFDERSNRNDNHQKTSSHFVKTVMVKDEPNDIKNIFEELKINGETITHDDSVNTNLEEDFTRGNSLSDDVNIKNRNFNNEGNGFNYDKGENDQIDEKRFGNVQSSIVVSALRRRLGNPPVLRWNRLHWTISMAGTYSEKLYFPPPHELPQQRLPQAIIIGFGKCGTRALIDFLSIHPNIVTTGPEIHFYDVDENFNKGLGWYRAQMPVSYSNQITLEKTPSYIWSERAMMEMYKLDKHLKLIVILKDPVSRVVSQAVRSGPGLEDLCMIMKSGQLQVNNDSRTVQWSIYSRYLQAWMNKFPKSQIHVLETTEFAKQPATELQKIETFLGVPHLITESNFYFNATKGYFCKRPFHVKEISCLPDGKGRQHPTLHPVVEKKLYDFFRGYNQDLFLLLGRTFKWEPKTVV